jgi:hypothetical protein
MTPVKHKKKWIKDTLKTSIEMEGSVDGIILSLQELKQEFTEKGYSKFEIEEYTDYDDDYTSYGFVGQRLENDIEFKARVDKYKKKSIASKKAAETRAKKKEDSEFAQYEKLHKKFQGKL